MKLIEFEIKEDDDFHQYGYKHVRIKYQNDEIIERGKFDMEFELKSGQTVCVYSRFNIQIDLFDSYYNIFIRGTSEHQDNDWFQIKDKNGDIEEELREIENYLNNIKINKKMFNRMVIKREYERKVN